MSLVTAPAHTLAVCGACGGNRVTSLTMTLTDGSPVHFASCQSCESKAWSQGGRRLDLPTVLGKAQKHKA